MKKTSKELWAEQIQISADKWARRKSLLNKAKAKQAKAQAEDYYQDDSYSEFLEALRQELIAHHEEKDDKNV